MFRHILIPTDGSRLARKGVRAGVRLAAALGARVTGVYVMLPMTPRGADLSFNDSAIFYAGISGRGWQHAFDKAARRALSMVEAEARAAKVRCDTLIVHYRQPWKGILTAAHRRKCDAIAIASHGRGGLGGLLLGSETQSVLARSRIPVLVAR
jgi:nucleotide-binding universal stress UspA family protein